MAHTVQQRLPPSRSRSTGHLGPSGADPTRNNRVTPVHPGAPLHFWGGATVRTQPLVRPGLQPPQQPQRRIVSASSFLCSWTQWSEPVASRLRRELPAQPADWRTWTLTWPVPASHVAVRQRQSVTWLPWALLVNMAPISYTLPRCAVSFLFGFVSKHFAFSFTPQAVLNGVGVNRRMLPRAFGWTEECINVVWWIKRVTAGQRSGRTGRQTHKKRRTWRPALLADAQVEGGDGNKEWTCHF